VLLLFLYNSGIILSFCRYTKQIQYLSVSRQKSTSSDSLPLEKEASNSEIESFKAPLNEIERRRNFAIISHPDAGYSLDKY
jgi:hypothetical protein